MAIVLTSSIAQFMECRMLEAAMLGIPYQGRIPDFTAQPARPDQPVSSTAVAGRAVREEQDYAYQQSLQVWLLLSSAEHLLICNHSSHLL